MRFVSGVALLTIALVGCGTPQRLPLEIPRCDAVRTAKGGVTFTALVTSRATKPISGLVVAVDFYHDFRTATVQGSASIKPELDPGQQRSIAFKLGAAPAQAQGRAMRCFATRVEYQDGTSEDVTPSR